MDTNVPLGVKVNGHTIKVSIRDLIQIGIIVASIIGVYFLSSSRLNIAETSITDLYKKHTELFAAYKEMDSYGTHRSHEEDTKQQQMIDYNTTQIDQLNKVMRDLQPKVDKIDTNVLWLMTKQLEHK